MADEDLDGGGGDEVIATAHARASRENARATHQKVNNIKAGDVVSLAHVPNVVSAETAKFLNPTLGDTTAMTDEARADALTFFAVHSRPKDATVRSKGFTYTSDTHTGGWLRHDQVKPAQLFGMEACVLNAFVGGGLGGKLDGARRHKATVTAQVWDKDVFLLELAIAAHRSAQNYLVNVDEAPVVDLGAAGGVLTAFDEEGINTANLWMGALMGKLPDWLKFDKDTVRRGRILPNRHCLSLTPRGRSTPSACTSAPWLARCTITTAMASCHHTRVGWRIS